MSNTFENASWLEEFDESYHGNTSKLKYCYVTLENEETNDRNKAELTVLDDIYYLIKCPRKMLKNYDKKYQLKDKNDTNEIISAFLSEEASDVFSPCSSSAQFFEKLKNSVGGEPGPSTNYTSLFITKDFSKKCHISPKMPKIAKYSSNISKSWSLQSGRFEIILLGMTSNKMLISITIFGHKYFQQ